jgi:hypothetical protein
MSRTATFYPTATIAVQPSRMARPARSRQLPTFLAFLQSRPSRHDWRRNRWRWTQTIFHWQELGYDLIRRSPRLPLRRESTIHAGPRDHRTDCSSTKHKEGLRKLLALGGFSMKLSAPVYHLKRKAKILSREENIRLPEALVVKI